MSHTLERSNGQGVQSSVESPQSPQGVTRIQNISRRYRQDRGTLQWLLFTIGLTVLGGSLDYTTTVNYLPAATSNYSEHSFISSIGVLENVASAVARPVFAKICDSVSRHHATVAVAVFYIVGFTLTAASDNVGALAAGRVMCSSAEAGLQITTYVLVADLTPLRWRGMVNGLLLAPNLVTAWVCAKLAGHFLAQRDGWRLGYGIFAIIVPVLMLPLILTLFYLDHVSSPSRTQSLRDPSRSTVFSMGRAREILLFVNGALKSFDCVGLALLALGLSLLLLPISLAPNAQGGWNNASMIAMLTIGITLLVVFTIWELFMAPMPMMSKRILCNRTFMLAAVIELTVWTSAIARSTYYSSFVYIIKDWTDTNWSHFNSATVPFIATGSAITGILLAYLHRFKHVLLGGTSLRILGLGLSVYARGRFASTGALVISTIFTWFGTACADICTNVAAQGSVPHDDVATVTAMLSVCVRVGSTFGSAGAGAIWTSKMLKNMRTALPDAPEATIKELYGSIQKAREQENRSYRVGVIEAYNKTVLPIFTLALCLSIIPVLCTLVLPNFCLGGAHNLVEYDGDMEVNDVVGAANAQSYESTKMPSSDLEAGEK